MSVHTKLSGIFGNGTVLQREASNIITGTDPSARRVTVEIENKTYSAEVRDGKFSVEIPPHAASFGLTVTITGTDRVVLENVCFGDVFMLSGQSNMELPLSRVRDVSSEEIDAADNPYIRQYRLTPQYVFRVGCEAELPEVPWTKALPGEIEEMSAVGFFFAQRTYKKINVPIGLILNAQGGSSIEAWMPMNLLDRFDDYNGLIEPFLNNGSLDKFLANRESRIAQWYESVQSEDSIRFSTEKPGDAESILLPAIFPASRDEKFSGSMWFYREFVLEKEPTNKALLYLGELIDSDDTYINGVLVGQTGYRYPPRKYAFDASVLRKGKNLIAVRLVVQYGKGGFVPEHPYYLDSGNERIELSGQWSYAIERKALNDGVEGFLAQKLPSGLFRASILPLRGFSMRGVLWYQGESNSGEAERYDEKFAAMVEAWRTSLGDVLPIICVELADYTDPVKGAEKGWSEIQRMQLAAPDMTIGCGVVSAKDLGAPFELHPQFKSELGKRLSDKALEMIYDVTVNS